MAFVLAIYAASWILKLVLHGFSTQSTALTNVIVIGQGTLVYAITIAVLIGVPWAVLKLRTTWHDLGLARLPEWRDIGLALAGVVLYFVGASALLFVVSKLIPGFDVAQTQELGISKAQFGWELSLIFLLFVVVGPIAEEIVFRGYLFGALRRARVPFWLAALVTSALFGLAHMQWNVGLNVFVLSLVMCATREMTGSLWASIFIHMIKNGVAFSILMVTGIL